jgi:hypothetical protein
MKLLNYIFVLLILAGAFYNGYAQVTSAGSGDWSNTATWVGGVLPDSTTDVIIAAGHTVKVDNANAVCKNISFGDVVANLEMGDTTTATVGVLSIYGNFTNFSTSHIAFSTWVTGSKVKFTGSSATQTISNLSTSTTTAQTYFMELQVDKSSGKVTTTGTDVKLNIGTSLEVINGTFELASTDDIQGRVIGNSPSSPDIIVQPGGVFTMVTGASHIRRASNTTSPSNRIGELIVYGTCTLTTSSSNGINFNDVTIKAGGNLVINSISTNKFNCDTLTVESYGKLTIGTTLNFWASDASVILNNYGIYNVTTSGTFVPPTLTNNGTFLYDRSGATQTILDIDYHRLVVGKSGTKTWTLAGNRVIADSLEINNSVPMVLAADSSQTLTVNGTLRLTSGSIDNSDADVTLIMADASLISRATGTITNAPTFAGVVDVRYSSGSQVTTGTELPTATDKLRDLIIAGSGGVILGENVTVNRNLTLSYNFDNNGALDDKVLTMADNSTIRRATGTLSAAPTFAGNVNLEYISTASSVTTGVEVPTADVLNNLTISSTQGVTLGNNMTVNGALNITGSNLTTSDGYTLTLGSSATITESPGTTVVGNLTTTRTIDQNVNNDFGGIGIEINAVDAAPGSTIVLRKTGSATSGNGNDGIKRYFDIAPANNTNLNATLVFKYDESELNSISEEKLKLFKSTDNGTNWTLEEGIVNTTENTITKTGVNSFSKWTAGDSDNPLPVELTSFTASVKGKSVNLNWRTATEVNNYGFNLERTSVGSSEWETIGFVNGHGNSNSAKEYSFIDKNVTRGSYEYRLKQIDTDGNFSYSDAVNVEVGSIPTEFAVSQNYPNPFNPATKIEYVLKNEASVKMELYNVIGEKILTLIDESQTAGYYLFDFDASKLQLTSGIYFIRLSANELNSSNSFSKVIKMVINK